MDPMTIGAALGIGQMAMPMIGNLLGQGSPVSSILSNVLGLGTSIFGAVTGKQPQAPPAVQRVASQFLAQKQARNAALVAQQRAAQQRIMNARAIGAVQPRLNMGAAAPQTGMSSTTMLLIGGAVLGGFVLMNQGKRK